MHFSQRWWWSNEHELQFKIPPILAVDRDWPALDGVLGGDGKTYSPRNAVSTKVVLVQFLVQMKTWKFASEINWPLGIQQNNKIYVFPRIVSAETVLFWKWKMWKFSYSVRIMAIFYFINWIVAAETIEWGKLFKGGNYLRKYGIWIWNFILGAVLVLRHHAKASKADRTRPFYCFKCLKAKM
jgi:hypothetical protein